jgi:hypothetical protein
MKGLVWLFLAAVLCVFLPNPISVQADSNIGISGTFNRPFQMLQGETLSTPDVYVVVFNNGSDAVSILLEPNSPSGVEITLSKEEFSIPAKGSERVDVGLVVGKDVVPGDYVVSVTANIKETGENIVITPGAQMQARLSVFGEAGTVKIGTYLVTGELFQSDIHVYRKMDGQLLSAASSVTGEVKTRLVPGEYFIQAFYKEVEVAKGEFVLEADETEEIALTAQTIFVDGLTVLQAMPNIEINYNIRNIYQSVKNIQAKLMVDLNGKPLEEKNLISLPDLNVGVMEGSYSYQPAKSGEYVFKIQVSSEGIMYAESVEKLVTVKITGGTNWPIIAVVAVAAIIAVILAIILIRKRR